MSKLSKYKGLSLLIALLVVIPWAVWSLALKNTYGKHRMYNKNIQELSILNGGGEMNSGGDYALPIYETVEELIYSGRLMREITAAVDNQNVVINKYTPYVISHSDGVQVSMAELQLTGDYKSLVKLIERMEGNLQGCKISSVTFKSVKSQRTGKIKLTGSVILLQLVINEK